MSTTTTNYGLIKPDTTDPILIGQLNDNADAIDAALKENADAIENKPDAADIPAPSTTAPAMDGTGSAGTSSQYARADHVHPSDTSKQNALSSTQLAAVNSGIDSTKVAQIETNKNNILSLTANGGGKNKLQITATSTTEMTINDDKSVSITVNATTTKQYNLTGWIPNNYVGMKISGMTVNSNVSTGYFISAQYSINGSSWVNETDIATVGSATILDYPYIRIAIVVRENNNINDVLFKPMISVDGGGFQPYALSNAELTAKEQQNENNILSLLPTSYSSPTLIDGTTCTINEGGYITVGNIIVVNVTFTTSASYTKYGVIMQFPVPKNSGSITMVAAAHIDSSVNVAVNKYGQIALFDTPLPAGTYHFFTVYLRQ